MARRKDGGISGTNTQKHNTDYWYEFIKDLADAKGGWYKGIIDDALTMHKSKPIPYPGPLPSIKTLRAYSSRYKWRDTLTKSSYFNIAQQALVQTEKVAQQAAAIDLPQIVARQKAIADEWEATAESLREQAMGIIQQFAFEDFTPRDAIALMEIGFKISHGASNLQRSLVGLELATDKVVQENQTITNIVVQGSAAKEDALRDIAHDTTAEDMDL